MENYIDFSEKHFLNILTYVYIYYLKTQHKLKTKDISSPITKPTKMGSPSKYKTNIMISCMLLTENL